MCFIYFSQDDLAFKLEYVHPYLDGVYNPRNRTFRASCFNSRKLSPVFTGGSAMEEVPPIWVDRVGFKANVMEVGVYIFDVFFFPLQWPYPSKHHQILMRNVFPFAVLHTTKQVHLWTSVGRNHDT